jgi:hypothetical protein
LRPSASRRAAGTASKKVADEVVQRTHALVERPGGWGLVSNDEVAVGLLELRFKEFANTAEVLETPLLGASAEP